MHPFCEKWCHAPSRGRWVRGKARHEAVCREGHRGHTIGTYPFEVADQTNRNQDSRQNIWRLEKLDFPTRTKGGVA